MKYPAWLDELPASERDSARITYLIRYAALHATPEGRIGALSERCGLHPGSLHTIMHRGAMSPEVAVAIERTVGAHIVARADFLPAIFA